MNRRSTLKHLLGATGALITLPAWANSWNAKSLWLYSSTFTASQQDILTAVVDTIIPSSPDKMGALTVGVDSFLQKLFDKCYEQEVKDNVKAQLTALDNKAMTTYGTSFSACTYDQRITLLNQLSISEDKSEFDFFKLIKTETIRGYNTSEPVMTHLNYKVAPGHYYGCVDVNA
ncbi:MAG: gluconate 2-dehydrogenase subunit 3 family protein [Saprospiraceae bacterium]